ncbi:MAG: DUF302 domain-containing protein [Paludibacter sp.]|nr:DUF302 domain-containing protein [Paludibacter sp.]
MENMFLEYQSKYAFDETIEILAETISNGGWKISIIHDLQQTLKNNSIDVLPLKVIELCNPKYSSQILKESDLRIYSAMMPCRISVYEKADGKVYISTINSGLMSEQIGGLVQQVMTAAFHDAKHFISVVI